jgi:hypothetical protein
MRCLYCGKHLALFRKLTGGGEFCSDAHREKYHEEYNRLAVSRLLQAQTRPEEAKPKKKKAESRPAAVSGRDGESSRDGENKAGGDGGGGGVIAVEAEEAEIDVVALSTEYFHQRLSPVAAAPECMPVECEPVLSLNSPELAPVPDAAPPALEPADLRLHVEAGFLSLRPQPLRAGGDTMEATSPLSPEAPRVFPTRSHAQIDAPSLAEAAAITVHSLPAPGMYTFEPLASGVTALEFDRSEPMSWTTSLSPVTNDLRTVGLVGLALASLPPEDGLLEFEASLPFRYLLERHPSFDAGLTLRARDVQTENGGPLVDVPPIVVNGIAGASPEPAPEPAPEPVMVTPRGVLEVLSRMQGDGSETAPPEQPVATPVQRVAPAAKEPPPAVQSYRPLSIPALAPSPAALTAGFPAIAIEIPPRLLPYIPLPLRPKMAVGNALGPRVARNGGRRGPADSPKNMTKSMLHLDEQGAAGADTEAGAPTLFGKLGGLFGKKHKNH